MCHATRLVCRRVGTPAALPVLFSVLACAPRAGLHTILMRMCQAANLQPRVVLSMLPVKPSRARCLLLTVGNCRGYTPFIPPIYNPVHSTVVDACVSEVRTTVNHADQYTVNITRYAHDPWRVRWRPSDTSSMSPQPPAMDSCGPIKSWVPGQTIEPAARPTCRSNGGGGGGFIMGKIFGIAFGLGIPFLIFLGVLCCCCLNRRKKRRAEAAWRERRQGEREEREAAAREGTRPSREEGIELQDSLRPTRKSVLNRASPAYTTAEPRPVAEDEPPPSYAQHRRDDRVLNITRAE